MHSCSFMVLPNRVRTGAPWRTCLFPNEFEFSQMFDDGMRQSMMLPRTAIILDEAVVRVGERLFSPFSWWRFAGVLANHCESVTLSVPLKQAADAGEAHPLEPGAMRVAVRPYFERMYEFYARLPKTWKALRAEAERLVAEHDLIIGRMPGPFSRWVAGAAAKARKPMALFVAGDVVAGSAFDTDRGMARRTLRAV